MINRADSTLHAHCVCGGKMKVSAPYHVAAEAYRVFWKIHDGKGHGPCDAKTCDTNRRNAELAESQQSFLHE